MDVLSEVLKVVKTPRAMFYKGEFPLHGVFVRHPLVRSRRM